MASFRVRSWHTLGCKLFGMDSVLPYSIHCPSLFTYSTHMGSVLENVSSCTRSVHSINNSSLRLFWKAFVCSVTWWPFCTWSLECKLELRFSSKPTLFLRDGIDLLFAILKWKFITAWNHLVAGKISGCTPPSHFKTLVRFWLHMVSKLNSSLKP